MQYNINLNLIQYVKVNAAASDINITRYYINSVQIYDIYF